MENTREQQVAVEDIYRFAADLMVNKGMNDDTIKRQLIKKGLTEKDSLTIIANLNKEVTGARKRRAKKDIIYGFLWFAGGSIVTAVTFAGASAGGSYFVAYGAIIFGGFQCIKGLINYYR